MTKLVELKTLRLLAALFAVSFLISCGDDKEPGPQAGPDPVAAFSFEANELEVTFTNNSQNATGYAWDFGDDAGTSTSADATVSYTYASAGTYTVSLTATNDDGASNEFTADVTVASTNEKLILLRGTESKTWKLVREGTAMLLASDPAFSEIWWPGSSNNGARACLYDDTFTFNADGTYSFDDAGTFWAEFGVFNGVEGCDSNTIAESCFDVSGGSLTNECGDDVSAWLSNNGHMYTYDTDANKITLTGNGAWIGIPKLGTTAATTTPSSEVIFDVILKDGGASGVDTMHVSFNYGAGGFWAITYVSYDDPSLEPALVSVNADFAAATNGLTATFTNNSSGANTFAWDFGDGGSSTEESPVYTYAAEGTYTVTLTASDASGSSATATKDVTVSAATLTDPAPTPTQAEADVISIYSDAYTSVSGVDINPNWAQATVTTEQEIVAGDMVVKMEGLNYQGIDFGGAQDISGETMVHIDVWTASTETFNFFLISNGAETPYSITTTGGQWDSIDIALSAYSSVVDLTGVIQFKFDDGGSGTAPTIYYDNIYFY